MEMSSKLPQLAKAGDPETIRGALMEPKLDGHRVLAFVGHNDVTLYARTGVDKTARTPTIARELREDFPAGTILDGEIVADLDLTAGGDWAGVQTILGSTSKSSDDLTFVVFDVLKVMGEDVRLSSLSARRQMLELMFDHNVAIRHVRLIDQVPYTAEAVAALIDNGWEGAIVKDPLAPYASGKRGHGWLKIKAVETEDVVVLGATEGKGRFDGQIGALVFGQIAHTVKDGAVTAEFQELGQCSGMTDAERLTFTDMRDNGHLSGIVIEVQHMGRMPSGGWRHPQFKRIRADKLASECMFTA